MFIDESIAKGLVKLLLAWLPDDIENAKGRFKKKLKKSMLLSRSGLKEVQKYHFDEFGKFSLCYLVGGSKRNPYIGFVAVNPLKNKRYEGWVEEAVFGEVVICNLYNGTQHSEGTFAKFAIGQHALARVYQRSKLINENNITNPYSIISELKFIPLWASYWSYLFRELSAVYNDKFNDINLYIPSPNGLFLGKLKKFEELKIFEIRTYIHSEQLTTSQALARNILLMASDRLENSVLSIFPLRPAVVPENIYYTEIGCLVALLSYRLKLKINDLAETMISDNDNFKVYEMKKFLYQFLIRSPLPVENLIYLEKLLNKGYDAFNYEFLHPGKELKNILGENPTLW